MSNHPKLQISCRDCQGLFLATAAARYCPDCRWKHRGKKAKKYPWTPERDATLRARYDGKVRGNPAQVAALFGWPTCVIKKRAAALGLCYAIDRRDWTEEETAFLMDHAGDRTSGWISKQLKRSETSVVLKFKRLKISRRVRDGYTLRDLEMCFGVDHRVIERWVREGKLYVRKRHTARPLQVWKATDENILQFIVENPMAFRLDKVDQVWFLDLITSGGLIRKALRAARAQADPEEELEEVTA